MMYGALVWNRRQRMKVYSIQRMTLCITSISMLFISIYILLVTVLLFRELVWD